MYGWRYIMLNLNHYLLTYSILKGRQLVTENDVQSYRPQAYIFLYDQDKGRLLLFLVLHDTT